MKSGGIHIHNKSLNKIGTFVFLHVLLLIISVFFSSCGHQSNKVSEITSLLKKAYGAESEENKIVDFTVTGNIIYYNYYGQQKTQIKFKESFKYPGKIRIDLYFDNYVVSDSWDGVYAREKIGESKPQKINPNRFITNLRINRFPYIFFEQTYKFTVMENEIINNDTCFVLSGRYSGHEVTKYFINKNNGFLMRYQGRSHFAQPGMLTLEFENMQKINGRLHSGRIIYYINNHLFRIKNINELKVNDNYIEIDWDILEND